MALCKNLSARGVLGRSATPNTRSISPKLIKLGIESWYTGGFVGLQLVALGRPAHDSELLIM